MPESNKTGVLLVNLGTPDAPTPSAIRRYLAEFLWDERVIDLARPLWWCILRVILLIRPRKVAPAYQRVWTEDGSPLLAIGRRQAAGLQAALDTDAPGAWQVELGMRYGNPPIASALQKLLKNGVEKLIVLPLYPQYSATTTASTFDAIAAELAETRRIPGLRFIDEYHVHPAYIAALADSVRAYWASHGRSDKLMMSFHGIPQRYCDLGDPYREHCQSTAAALAAALELDDEQWLQTYQSRVGREVWLQPYTDKTLETLGAAGGGTIDVICPGFPSDCLETLDEIAVENCEIYVEAGGAGLRYIPALNDSPAHINMLKDLLA